MASSHAAQYRDQRWFRLRKERLALDHHKCADCGALGGLQVHHVRYIPGLRIWEYPLWLLRTLCDDCHIVQTKKHRRKRALTRFVRQRFRRWKRGH